MKPILIDELVKDQNTSSSFTIEDKDLLLTGWQIAKPLNYDPDYLSKKERKEMADAVLAGKAIAVCFFEDLSKEDQLEYLRKHLYKTQK